MFAPSKRLRGTRLAPTSAAVLLAAVAILGSGSLRAAESEDKDAPPEPQVVNLKASDGVNLAATYYPSKLGKDAVPIILVHALKGSRADLNKLALTLQRDGHAVIAPDLRGHGDSAPPPHELGLADFDLMVTRDLESVKRFLVAENNAGRLNIERLGVVGVELGASVAINWIALDWSWPVLAAGKQGQDVKGVVVISPEWAFHGMKIAEAVAQPSVRSEVAMLIVVGRRDARLLREARRLHTALAKHHPAPSAAEADAKQTLWLKTPATSLQGTQLVNEKSLEVDEMIRTFIQLRLVDKPYAWSMRQSPLPQ